MKIELKEPFLEDFKAAYVNISTQKRRVTLLVRKDGSKTSMSYARYLMCCKLGRFLEKNEHVDHIDNDGMNDVIENLQILSPKENNAKKNKFYGIEPEKLIELICPICGVYFKRPSRNTKHKLQKGKTPCCSRKCGGKFSHITKDLARHKR